MGIRDLFFNINAKDRTGQAFASVRSNLNSVEGLAASVGDRVGRLGKRMQRTGLAMTAMGTPLLFAFRDSLRLYDQQIQAEARLEQGVRNRGDALGFTVERLLAEASALQELTRLGDEQILGEVTGQLLTFGNIAGDQFLRAQTAAIDVSAVLQKLGSDGADLQSVTLALGKALDDPIRGMTMMSRMGITFSDSQKEMVKSLVESGRMLEAQDLILDEIISKYGGQAEALAQVGLGPAQQARNAWGDLKEDVGRTVSEILPPVVTFFRTIIDGFLGLPEPMRNFISTAGMVVLALGPLLIAGGLLVSTLGAVGAAWFVALGPIGWAVGAIAAVGGLFAALWPEVDKSTASTDNLTRALGDELTQAQILDQAISGNITMSRQVAGQKLEEARARLQNVQAIWEERRALELDAAGRVGVGAMSMSDLQAAAYNARISAGEVTDPQNRTDIFDPRAQAEYEGRVGRDGVSDPIFSEDHRREIELIESNIERLETALESAEGELVTFGGALITPLEPAERTGEAVERATTSVGALGGAATDALPPLKSLEEQLEDVEGIADELGQGIADELKQMVKDFDFSWRAIGDIVLSAADRIFDRLLDQFFDPVADALTGLFQNVLSPSGSSGGLLGGLFGWIGNLFAPPKVGMNTGGELAVTGRNGIDRNIARFRVSADETIKVMKRGQPDGGNTYVTIQTQDVESFRRSRGQVARDIGRAVAAGQRFA